MGNKNPFAFFLGLKLEEKAPEPFVLSLVRVANSKAASDCLTRRLIYN